MPRLLAADVHGFDAGYAVDAHLIAGHGLRPLFHEAMYFLYGNLAIKIISAADGARAMELRFHYSDIHFTKQAAHRLVHLRLFAYGAGVVHRERETLIIRKWKGV